MKCIFSIDVEDWFHILDLPTAPAPRDWNVLPSHVEKNFLRLLDILDERNAKCTCFFLGWVARRFPQLVREAQKRGHEIASHGDQHLLVYEAGPQRFFEDAATSKKIIEDIAGKEIWGYRASGFSVTKDTPWFFDKLLEAGYRYDSSVFPAARGHGGLQNGHFGPYRTGSASRLVEFPVAVEVVAGKPLCFFGGVYLRFFPYRVVKSMTQSVLQKGRPVIFYVHPREVDPTHPRLPMNWKRRFKSYYNLESTERKIRQLQTDFELTTFRNYMDTEMR